MNFRSWLKRNFLLRGLRWLSERAQAELFSSIRLPSLFPRHISPAKTLLKDGRQLDVVSDENVSVNRDYAEWIAPLNSLPGRVTIDQLKEAIEALPNYDPQGQYFFPSESYLAATRSHQHLAVEFVHRCRVQRGNTDDPEVMLIYDRPQQPLQYHPDLTQRNLKQGERKWQTLLPNG
jgi:hypothetical protein